MTTTQRFGTGHVLVLIAGIYVTQSLVGAVMFMGIPAVLRDSGTALDLIGLTYLFMLPWTLKFLWSPALERYRLAVDGRRRSLTIIVVGQALMVTMLAALAFTAPAEQLTILLAGLAVIAIIASTVDIACDGFTVEQLHGRVRGWGNVMQVGGGYLGMTLGAGLFLVLVGKYGWWIAMLSMAGLAMLLTLPALLSQEPPGAAASEHTARPSLRAALARAPIRWGLLVMVLFQVAPRMIQGIAGPFLVDRGADLVTLGMVSGSLGTAISLGGVLLAGLIVRRWEAADLLCPILILHGLIFIALVIALSVPSVPLTVYFVLSLAENGLMAGAFVILYTAAMQWSSLRQAGVDFTLFQCADAAIAAVAGMGAATLAHQTGYAATFILAVALVALATALLPAILRRVGGEAVEDVR